MSAPPISARIYVGNINFNATEDELKDFFSDYSVVSVEIPTKTVVRGKKTVSKRLGFGFVQFDSEENANKAIEQLNGREFKLRQIYAKNALPPTTEEERKEKAAAYAAKKKEKKEKQLEIQAAKAAEGGEKPKSAKKSKKVIAKKEGSASLGASETTSAEAAADGASAANGSDSAQGDTSAGSDNKAKKGEIRRSKTTVFVANLDHKVTSKKLLELFSAHDPVWVHVPKRKVPYHVLKIVRARKVPLYNAGIGFVKFLSEEAQLKAIEDLQGAEVNGNKIVLDIAIDRVETPENGKNRSEGSPGTTESSESAEFADAAAVSETE